MSSSEQTKIACLDKGFVELIGTFGDDLTVVNAARVSFHKESKEMNTANEKLINFLAKHNHNTPFFHPQARMRIKMPIFVAREWFRHTVGFARNEVSRRYVDEPPECYEPAVVRARDVKLKQGSKSEGVENHADALAVLQKANHDAMAAYDDLLKRGVAPEVARTVLPQGMYTEFIETASISAYQRLCNLRLDSGAQWEIRQYAEAVVKLLEPLFPVSWKALMHSHEEI